MADTQAEVNLKRSEFLDDIFEGIRNHGIHGNDQGKSHTKTQRHEEDWI